MAFYSGFTPVLSSSISDLRSTRRLEMAAPASGTLYALSQWNFWPSFYVELSVQISELALFCLFDPHVELLYKYS